MITVIYSVACSVDGFIADADGGIDWLSELQVEGEDFGFGEFMANIDAMIMGSATYRQVVGFGDWPYGETPCWVLSTRPLPSAAAAVTVTDDDPAEVLATVDRAGLERVWLVGGGTLAGSFRVRNLIDECVITVLPIVLSSGVPLFADDGPASGLHLIRTEVYRGGAVGLHYERAADS